MALCLVAAASSACCGRLPGQLPGQGFVSTARRRRCASLGSADVHVRHRGRLWRLRRQARLRYPSYEEASRIGDREWFDMVGSRASFGASNKLEVPIEAPLELAEAWLFGEGPADDSVDRIIRAARPGGGGVRHAVELEDPSDGAKMYTLDMPTVELPAIGSAKSSFTMYGLVYELDAVADGSCRCMELGTAGDSARASLELYAGPKFDLPFFKLNVTGALGIRESRRQRCSVVGWVSLDIQGELPGLGPLSVPVEVIRVAAKEVCRQTIVFTTSTLERELASNFARWRVQQQRARIARRAASKSRSS